MNIGPVSDKFQNAADWIGRKMSSPQQRILQGVTGLAIQPLIEYKNKGVDDDTRAVATARMVGKVFSGALVGVIVRALCIALMGKLAKTPSADEFAQLAQKGVEQGKKAFKDLLAPSASTVKKMIDEQGKSLPDIYSDYRNGMGTLIGTLVGMYTNFSIDVPITEWMTGKLTPVFKDKIAKDNKKTSGTAIIPQSQALPSKSAITPIDNYLITPDDAASSLSKGGANG